MRTKMTTEQKAERYAIYKQKKREQYNQSKQKEQTMSESTELSLVDVVEQARLKIKRIRERTIYEAGHKLGMGEDEVAALFNAGMLPDSVNSVLLKAIHLDVQLDNLLQLGYTKSAPLLLEFSKKVDAIQVE